VAGNDSGCRTEKVIVEAELAVDILHGPFENSDGLDSRYLYNNK
jgi:hypothetical protein